VRAPVAGLCAAVALLACAAVAVAATPSTGLHRGRSSQDARVDVKVGSDHRVRRFRIGWSAPCDSGQTWDAGTTAGQPFDQDTGGSFDGSGSYSDPDAHGGFRGHYRYDLSGRFTKPHKAHGSFHIRVRITQNGTTKDHCRKTVTWKVS
jgi:hypothetical protein